MVDNKMVDTTSERRNYILYKLTDPNNLVYYGLTKDLKQRLKLHRSKNNGSSSKQLDLDNVVVEEIANLNNFLYIDACKIESEYIKRNECVNTLVSYASPEEKKQTYLKWREKNKELLSAKRRVRYLENKEENNKQSNQWYKDNKAIVNQKYTCECGGKFTKRHKHDHVKTKKHIDWLSNKNITKGIDGYFQEEQTAIQAS